METSNERLSLTPNENFYKDGAEYWSKIPPTVDGMLGGFSEISTTDIHSSKTLLKQLFTSTKQPLGRGYALDCGAGIGRITKFLLSDLFDRVDMVEQNPQFLESAKKYLGKTILEKKIGQMFPVGLQDFRPEPGKYDVIWCQWVLGHLTDEDFVAFFERCKLGIKPKGVIIVKENISSGQVEVDTTDSSVTRPMGLLRELFDKAGLDCCRMVKQLGFPKGLFTVYMFVLRPRHEENVGSGE
ncbi:N-terminal Xaa-Pro-Lys N-methyltransferase 1-B [Anthonomus grandis grandis]|uniref:N-terminal Xaa-Pro-Lys N-methyltransferase 1-B n=1 Tax=Anthonomus grandis grandis TaxID=2921223 RepID=UPI002166A906|nr:N-terminal Xaa-Pro-Lys N-methyltransferase 1-B [Anthonomus grandis grandis]